MFKIKKITISEKFPIDIGLTFKNRENNIRTLIHKQDPVDRELKDVFDDDHKCAWTRGYLIKMFNSGEFNYIGFKKE
jgi:hypothetical protein